MSFYNTRFNAKIVAITNPALFTLENGWLCGFADADGSFNLNLYKRKVSGKYRLRLRFYVDQAYAFGCFKKMQAVIGGTICEKNNKNKKPYHRLVVDTFNKAGVIVAYFNKFPPMTRTLAIRFESYQRVFNWHQNNVWEQHIAEIRHLMEQNLN